MTELPSRVEARRGGQGDGLLRCLRRHDVLIKQRGHTFGGRIFRGINGGSRPRARRLFCADGRRDALCQVLRPNSGGSNKAVQ